MKKNVDIDLVYYIDEDVPKNYIGDSNRLKQILYNLVGNAIKFTNLGYISVEVHLLKSDPCRLEIEVSDTGIGIEKDKLGILFEPFKQVNDNLNRATGGAGLGLSICKYLVELFNGSINVQSRAGRGSTFTFEVELAIDYSAVSVSDIEHKLRDTLKDKSIYILDDNAINCLFLKDSLKKMCKKINYSRIESDALNHLRAEYVKNNQYDILLLDFNMNKMNGSEVMAEIRKYDKTIKIILLSSTIDSSIINYSNFDSFLSKPIKQQQLFKTIYSVLNDNGKPVNDISRNDSPKRDIPQRHTKDKIQYSSMNILLAEDNKINRTIFKNLLLNSGFNHVYEAYNGINALEVLTDDIDIIFMDIHMPVMNGLEATSIIRKTNKNIPIFALTADVSAETKALCEQLDFTGFLTKPITIDDILKNINNIEKSKIKRTITVKTDDIKSKNNIIDMEIFNSVKEVMESSNFDNFIEKSVVEEIKLLIEYFSNNNIDKHVLEEKTHSIKGMSYQMGN